MPLGNRVKTDELGTTYTSEIYPLGTTYVQLADEVSGQDLLKADQTTAFTVATDTAANLQQGERTWIFVQAASAVTAGDLCKIDTTSAGTPFKVAPDAASETFTYLLRGVAQFDIASGSYGWICAKGTVVVHTENGVAAGDALASDGNTDAGQVDTYTVDYAAPGNTGGAKTLSPTSSIVGVALDADDAGSRYGVDFCQAIIDLL